MESAVIDVPLPDSPTIPRLSPGWGSNETPSTAFTIPPSVANWVRRSRTCRVGAANIGSLTPRARVERVAQPVAEEVKSHQGQRQGDRRRDHHVRSDPDR